MTEKEYKTAEYIFSEIGQIDDKFIAGATPAYGMKRSIKRMRTVRVVFVAAIIGIALLCIPVMRHINKLNFEPQNMSEALLKASKLEQVTNTKKDSIDLFDGSVKIIWKIKETDDFYFLRVSENDSESIISKTETVGKISDKISDGTGDYPDLLWINDGKGLVFAPYLEYSDGNIGYGELYEYKPEIEPNINYVKYVYEIINESGTNN